MMRKITMSRRMMSPMGMPPPASALPLPGGSAGSLVFAAHRLHHRGHARFQSAGVVAFLEERRDNVVGDVEAGRIGQRTFHAVAGLDKHLAVFDEDEKHSAVVASFLADTPGLRDALGVIGDRRFALHRAVNRDHDLGRSIAFELRQLLVQL